VVGIGQTFNLDAAGIANATGCPLGNVERYWPCLSSACVQYELVDRPSLIAVIATVATEVASFEPINEYGSIAYFTAHYENRADLGNIKPGDGARYHGRGFIQITGRSNYRSYGQTLGVPLEADPTLALSPTVAARILALYFRNHRISALANQSDWEGVRRAVNGGLNGWDRFQSLVTRLERAIALAGDALVEGAIGPDVLELKRMLLAWGRTSPLPQPIADTPVFGSATTAAVKAFQIAVKIQPGTGKVGQKTWDALEQAAVVHGI
jgi:Putative peptidoglycan binding domain